MYTYEMVSQADKDGLTYQCSDMYYSKEKGFHDSRGVAWSSLSYSDVPGGLNTFIHEDKWDIAIPTENEARKAVTILEGFCGRHVCINCMFRNDATGECRIQQIITH